MSSNTSGAIGGESRELLCDRCGAQPKLIQKMLDPRKGHTLRMYSCTCGEQIWTSNAE
jgi:hypothetical protein